MKRISKFAVTLGALVVAMTFLLVSNIVAAPAGNEAVIGNTAVVQPLVQPGVARSDFNPAPAFNPFFFRPVVNPFAVNPFVGVPLDANFD